MTSVALDKWQLLSPLGSGGMGEVWVARHTMLGHLGAIKLMYQDMAADQREVARFMQEGQIAAQLRHRNIVRVEDVGRAPDGRPYLVMELLEGESLERRLQRAGTFTPRMVMSLLQAACDALTYAHAAGVVHRDIKLANLFIAVEHGEEVLKILDFGLARISTPSAGGRRLTAPQAVLGTPKYMAPEQAMGREDIDARADLWSLSVVIYRMLTGHHPFLDRGTNTQVLVQVIQGKISPPSQHNPELSPAIDAWAMHALERDRNKRFQTASEMFESFARAVDLSETTDERTVLTPQSVATLLRGQNSPNPVKPIPVVTTGATVHKSSNDPKFRGGVPGAPGRTFEAPRDPTLPASALRDPTGSTTVRNDPRRSDFLRRTLRIDRRTVIALSIAWVLLVAALALVARVVRHHRAASATTHDAP